MYVSYMITSLCGELEQFGFEGKLNAYALFGPNPSNQISVSHNGT